MRPLLAFLAFALMAMFVSGCGPMDPAAKWRVYETRPAVGEPQIQVLDVKVSSWGSYDQEQPHVRVLMPDGTQWEVNLWSKEPRFWQVHKVEPDGTCREVPLEAGLSGQSLGGASWDTVDRTAAAAQPADPQRQPSTRRWHR